MNTIRPHLLTLAIGLIVSVGFANSTIASVNKIGVVGSITGSVTATDTGGAARALKASSPIYLNDLIASGANSKAQIMFLDKSALMVNAGTQVMVDRFVFDPATSSGELSMKTAKGALRFIGGALSKKQPVQIKTPVATIGIRGGIADTQVGGGGATDTVFVYGEELTMTNQNGQTQSITTPGQGLTLATGTSVPRPLPPARAAQIMGSFGGATGSADNAGGEDGGDDGTSAPAGSESNNSGDAGNDGEGQGKGKNDGAANNEGTAPGKPKPNERQAAAKPGASGPASKQGAFNRAGGSNGANGSTGAAGKPASGSADAGSPPPAGGTGFYSNTAGDNGTAPAGNAPPPPVGAGLYGGTTVGTGFNTGFGSPTGGFDGTPLQVQVPLSDATQGNIYDDALITFNEQPFVGSEEGMYALTSGLGAPISAGRNEFQIIGDRLNGKLIQGFPNPVVGPKYTVSLPWLANSGYQDVFGGSLDGVLANGVGYRTYDGAMSYYDMQQNGKQLRLVTGRVAPTDSWAASAAVSQMDSISSGEGLAFYDFLPDIAGFSSLTEDFFDYNTADSRLGNGYHATNYNPGLIVDWGKKRFITGQINWDSASSTASTLNRDMILAFGVTNTSNGLLDGRTYQFLNGGGGGTMRTGYLRTTDAYSQFNGARFSGLMLEGAQPDDPSLDRASAFMLGSEGPRIFQPVVEGYADYETLDSKANSTGGVRKGFAAGFVSNYSGGALVSPYKRYGNDNANDVAITLNTADGSVAADITLENIQNSTESIQAKFGTAGTVQADSAYLTDNLYAAQMGEYMHNYGSTTNGSGAATSESVLVSASLISDIGEQCIDCEFVDWGVWAGEANHGTSITDAQTDVAHMIPYVAGQITPTVDIPMGFGDVDYVGGMIGSTLDNDGNLTRHTGDFVAGINLDTRQLTDFDANFAGMHFGTTTAHTIALGSQATFDNISVQNLDAGVAINGTINGALFGPNAEDIAGNFSVHDTATNTEAAGVYIGTR